MRVSLRGRHPGVIERLQKIRSRLEAIKEDDVEDGRPVPKCVVPRWAHDEGEGDVVWSDTDVGRAVGRIETTADREFVAHAPEDVAFLLELIDPRTPHEPFNRLAADGMIATRATFYAALYPELREVAYAHGYALALHGSLTKDLDLVAIPWTVDARSEEELVRALCEASGGALTGDGVNPTERAHGRRVWTIHLLSSGGYLDLVVMPRDVAGPAPLHAAHPREPIASDRDDEPIGGVATHDTDTDTDGDPETFEPDWASAPGESVADLLEERGLTREWFITAMATRVHVNAAGILDGTTPITPMVAHALEELFGLGPPARFWLNRERHYREQLAKIQQRAGSANGADRVNGAHGADTSTAGPKPQQG